MATPPISDQTIAATAAAFEANGRNQTYTAAALNVSRETVQRHVRIAAERGLLGTKPVLPGFRISQITTTPGGGEFIQQKPEQGDQFEVPKGHAIKGISALLDPEGREIVKWVKTREEQASVESLVEAIRDTFESYRGASTASDAPSFCEDDILTVYPLVDWHVGLLAWSRETGEDYDLKIARDTIMRAMARVIGSSPPSSHAVVLGMGDMLHFDGYEPVTSRSRNFLDADGRYPKVLKTATEMIVATIDLALQRHRHVTIRILPGNHDDQSAVAISLALSMFYANNPRVTVDDSPSRWWWFRFDKVFLGGNHGEHAKMKDMPMVMASDRPDDWAASTYRRIYSAHVHHESRIEIGGVIVTSMRSPVAKDAYNSFNSWRSGRAVYSESFNRDGSEAASVQINI
jgi:DNA-binding MarR family transcriptional regulator